MVPRTSAIVLALALSLITNDPAPGADRHLDGESTDWCYGAPSGTRIENSAVRLSCGSCDGAIDPVACMSDAECPAGQACSGSHEEVVWFDARTDGAVNDLRTVATARDRFAIYFVVEVYSWLVATALANVQIALDFQPGGTHDLVDPHGAMVAPGACSGSHDRACTEDADCHFCPRSFEAPACCDEGTCEAGVPCRTRICGSGCNPVDPLDVCDTTQTCEGLGTTPIAEVGLGSSPSIEADYLVTYDFSRLLLGVSDAAQLSRWTDTWSAVGTFDVVGELLGEVFPPFSFELAIPWAAFGCTNWTEQEGCGVDATAASCGCPDFGPGMVFSFTSVVSRARPTGDFNPWGAIEDVGSEAVAGTTTMTTNSCPGKGIGTTRCEIADGSSDTFAPERVLAPGGSVHGLRLVRNSVAANPSVTLRWNPSCSFGDTDYEVYEGNLDALPAYDHAQVMCGTVGVMTATFNAGSGDRYYLVVPTDGTEEGSYGVDGAGVERPVAAFACRVQVPVLTCP
jgi:hypothetical protein